MEYWEFSTYTKVISGIGSIELLGKEISKREAEECLLITDKGILSAGIVDKVINEIPKNSSVQVFDEVLPNPDIDSVNETYNLLKEQQYDIIIAVGGGSVIDFSKALSLLITNGKSIETYFGRDLYKNKPLPLLVIPTTVGTGSEVTKGCVITDKKLNVKKVVGGADLAPDIAILDAGLLTQLPKPIIAATGMDALTHAIEGFLSKKSNDITDSLNFNAMRIINKNIENAYSKNSSILSIEKMLLASTITGIGFGNSLLGIVHSLSHAMGGLFNAPHGLLNAILLPHVLKFNWKGNPNKFAKIGIAFGLDIDENNYEESANKIIEHIEFLNKKIDIPVNFNSLGIEKKDIPKIVEIAINDIYVETNPRTVTYNDLVEILNSAT